MDKYEESEAVSNFRKYLQIPSVQPNVNYDECVQFLSKLGEDLKLPVKVINVDDGKPVVIITLEGKNTKLPSIFLNSHMDVVPVVPEEWTHPPFSAEVDAEGNIYGRGAQDMKCVGIQYIEAIRKHLKEGHRFQRTIHIAFVPDEEIGGLQGMGKLIHTEDFKQLNVGFALDEGMPTQSDEFYVFYAERTSWKVKIVCPGKAGHGSLLPDNTAGEKLQNVINKFFHYRAEQKQKLMSDAALTVGDVTSVNLTMISGGVQRNVLPSEISVTFDMRISINEDLAAMDNKIRQWCVESGPGVRCEFLIKPPKWNTTKLDDDNPWWTAFKRECDKMNLKLKPSVGPAAGDSRFLRQAEIPTLGFSPMNFTPTLLHDHDEYLNENVFLRGISIYYNIIRSLASI